MKLFNTMSRRKEEFVPLEEGKVRMYVCGPTVYNLIHIGNARPMIIFDISFCDLCRCHTFFICLLDDLPNPVDMDIEKLARENAELRQALETFIIHYQFRPM